MKKIPLLLCIATLVTLTACNEDGTIKGDQTDMNETSTHDDMDHSGHSSSGDVPEGLQEAEEPRFQVGSDAVIQTDHMEDMNGAQATISGAYDTTVYAISYQPTNGGEKITHHKWVVHEELDYAGAEPLETGDKAIIDTDHMAGMNGAEATIESTEQTTVYMVDFTPVSGGDRIMNHKWVTEDELRTP